MSAQEPNSAMAKDIEASNTGPPSDDYAYETKEPEVGTTKVLSANNGLSEADMATAGAIENIEKEYTIDSDNSPCPEVRANVPNTDDYHLPVNTLRMWFLGFLFTIASHALPTPCSGPKLTLALRLVRG